MKLNEIKPVFVGEYNLLEGIIPWHLTLTLERVITNGGIGDNSQLFIIAGLAAMFKNGGPYRFPRDLNSSISTDSFMIDAVKSLTPSEEVVLATWLLDNLNRISKFETEPACAFPTPGDPVAWLRHVCRKDE